MNACATMNRCEWQLWSSLQSTTFSPTGKTISIEHHASWMCEHAVFSRSILSIHIHLPYILLCHRAPGLLGNRVLDWAVTLLSSEQLFALARVYSCLHRRPSFWVGLGSWVWGLAGSHLQVDFGTCDREGLKNEKKWRKCGKADSKKMYRKLRNGGCWIGRSTEAWC